MAYLSGPPTIAELLSSEGFETELITRNPIFDGTIPGITRGFQRRTRVTSPRSGLNHMSIMLALSKPRFRRQIMETGFFHEGHRRNRDFVAAFARTTVPADREALAHAIERVRSLRRRNKSYFLFLNLFDVHAPYCPSEASIFRCPLSVEGLEELVRLPRVLPRLGAHSYLEPGFSMSERSRRVLVSRYQSAVQLMSDKIGCFLDEAESLGVFEDTLVIVTSDHGEAFGEHGLYLHDASVWGTHLHVPLWIHHPEAMGGAVRDVVSTKDLFGLIRSIAMGRATDGTILDPEFRLRHSVVVGEHFYSPHAIRAEPKYRQNLVTAICGDAKVIRRREGNFLFDIAIDPGEESAEGVGAPLDAFAERCRAQGASRTDVRDKLGHLQNWPFDVVAG